MDAKEFIEQQENRKIPAKWENEEFYLLEYVYQLMEEYHKAKVENLGLGDVSVRSSGALIQWLEDYPSDVLSKLVNKIGIAKVCSGFNAL